MENNSCGIKSPYSTEKPITYITIQIKSNNIYKTIDKIRKNQDSMVTIGDVITHSIIQSLIKFPEFNSNFDCEIKIFPSINIGCFINLGQGSKIGVIKEAEKKSITDISKEIKNLALKYMHKELDDSESLNSTFFISNLAPFNSYIVETPIYKHNSSVIAIASEFESFETINDTIIQVKRFNITLSYDSRIADCQRALNFLNNIKDILEAS